MQEVLESTETRPIEPPPPQSFCQAVPSWPSIFSFILVNTASFQIALGPPLVLLARRWGASPFYIGAITSLVPLLAILQLYMAPRVEYIGFKRVMLSGWTGRNIALALVAVLPFLAGWVSNAFLLEALFAFMFLFNFLRGIATASWFPWLAVLVPPNLRGRYWSLDQLTSNLSSTIALFLCGWLLGDHPGNVHFGLVYIVAFITGWAAIYFMNRIDAPPPKTGRPTLEPILVWGRRVWRDKPFRRLIRMNVVFYLAVGAWDAFTTLFMRDGLHVSERMILYISAVKTLGAIFSTWGWGLLSDRFGSRPVLALATRLLLVNMACWLLLALGLFPSSVWMLMGLSLVLQVGFLGFVIANMRYSLNKAPKAFPVLALTLFSVMQNLSAALAPNLWGLLLGALGRLDLRLGPLLIDRFTCFYGLMMMLMVWTKWLIRRLPDQQATATHVVLYHVINDLPLRTISALYKSLFPAAGSGQK